MKNRICFIKTQELIELDNAPMDKPTILFAWKHADIGWDVTPVRLIATNEPVVIPLPWYAPIKGFFHCVRAWLHI